MANSSSSYVKNEPTGPLYSDHEPNLLYTSIFDTSFEHNLPSQIDSIPPASSSIFIDAPVVPSNETASDLLQGFSAPTLPVYINMRISEQTGNVGSPSYVDHRLPSTTAVQRHSQHHPPYHSQNRNRYPYVSYYNRRSASQQPRTPNGIEKN
jgi:hypothetical protein